MSFSVVIAICLSCFFFKSRFVSSSNNNQQNSEFSPMRSNEYFMTSKSDAKNGFLDRRYFSNKDKELIHRWNGSVIDTVGEKYQHDSDNIWSYNLDRKSSKRQLIRYEFRNVVHCLDSLFVRRNRSVFITFIGDSIVRNQFMNFISLIPDYDRLSSLKKSNDDRIARYHKDNFLRSEILNDLFVSFEWNPIINEDLISIFNLWANSQDYQSSDLIFLGSTVHNMLKELNKFNDQSFLEKLEQHLLPSLLYHLKVHPYKQIIWMLQSPSTDLLAPISSPSHNDIIHVKKILDYNNIIRRVFKGSRIVIWDSLLPAAEEYIRSCALQIFQHYDNTVYEWCGDFIHYGNRILSIGSQLIYNHLCNF